MRFHSKGIGGVVLWLAEQTDFNGDSSEKSLI